jgi:hypothetical protein
MKNRFCYFICISLLFSLSLFAVEIPLNRFTLIESQGKTENDRSAPQLSFYEERNEVIRYQEVSLNERITTLRGLREGDELYLKLFDEDEFLATIDLLTINVLGVRVLRARIKGYDLSYMIITTSERECVTSISLPEKNEHYSIIKDPVRDQYFLMEIDLQHQDYLESAPTLFPARITRREQQQQYRIQEHLRYNQVREDDPLTIDVMVVYTPEAESWAESRGGIEHIISQAVTIGQTALDNSDTLISINLVHTAGVDYDETVDPSVIHLIRLTESPAYNPVEDDYYEHNGELYYIPGSMDEVHGWRDNYGADLVALLAYVSDTGGISWLLNDSYGRPKFGFSLTRVQQAATTSYTFVHELGHNMGLHHHAQQNVQPGPTDWDNWEENTWSAGWRWTGLNESRYCSVMTYTAGRYYEDGNYHARVAHFSNPEILHQGVPTGDEDLGDNARTLRGIRGVIASYRGSLPPGEETVVALGDKTVTVSHNSSGSIVFNPDPVLPDELPDETMQDLFAFSVYLTASTVFSVETDAEAGYYYMGGEWSSPQDNTNGTIQYDISIAGRDEDPLEIILIGGDELEDPPLPIQLTNFNLSLTSNQFVYLQWTTASESNLNGFNLYRNQSDSFNTAIIVNPSMIPATNTSIDQVYGYTDETVEKGSLYYYWLEVNELDLSHQYFGPFSIYIEEEEDVPETVYSTELLGAFPNPFNPSTRISFTLSGEAKVTVSVYDISGRKVRTVVSRKVFEKGYNYVIWDGKDDYDKRSGSGIYLYKMEDDRGYQMIRKMVLIK